MCSCVRFVCLFFFFNDTATTEIYTLSLHDALPISVGFEPAQEIRLDQAAQGRVAVVRAVGQRLGERGELACRDRKSTRLNSSHGYISYAVFCLKKKK